MKLAAAFVLEPDKPMEIPVLAGDLGRRKAYDDTTAAMIKATTTLIPQEVPPGSGEEAVGRGGVAIERRRGLITADPTGK